MERKLRIGFDFDGVLAYNPVRILRLPVSLLTRLFLGKGNLSYLSYYPKSRLEKFFWKSLHWTSFFPALGFSELKKLLVESKIEGYIISGRFAILEDSLEKWLAKHGAENLFAGCYINKNNEPPHLFKERMIRKLKLDIYVEDNWDIVNYLNERLGNSSSKRKSQSSKQIPRQKLAHLGGSATIPKGFGRKNSKSKAQNGLEPRLPAEALAEAGTLNLERNEVAIHWIYNILDRFKPYKNKHPYLKKFLESLNRFY